MSQAEHSNRAPRSARWAILQKRECWRLTVLGWALLALTGGGFLALFLFSVFPFLAVTKPMSSEILVVEGWIPDYGIPALKEEFESKDYKMIVVTGTPIVKGEPLAEYKTFAELTEAILERKGFPPDQVIAVPAQEVLRDRTYASAVALREWLARSGRSDQAITIFSRGCHARRTRLLFEKAFDGQIKVGIIASKDLRYDGRRWWKSSEGVRDIINETVAYLYAKFLFRPSSGLVSNAP